MTNLLFFAGTILITAFAPVLMLVAEGEPSIGEAALVIGSPWGRNIATVIDRANLTDVTPFRAPIGALVSIEQSDSVSRLYESGAWFVLKGDRILDLCGV